MSPYIADGDFCGFLLFVLCSQWDSNPLIFIDDVNIFISNLLVTLW